MMFVVLALAAAADNNFEAFRAFRTTPERTSVWRASGELSDPATGRLLARVEGLETCRDVNESTTAVARRYRYKDPSTGLDLSAFGKRKVSQPSDYVSVVRQELREDGRTVDVDAVVDGRRVAPSTATFTGQRLDVYLSPDGRPTPKRRLVGVGARGSTASLDRAKRGLKCRETYAKTDQGITYTRFGECPAWVGPGKLCALDLTLVKTGTVAGDDVLEALDAEPEEVKEVLEPPQKHPPPKWRAAVGAKCEGVGRAAAISWDCAREKIGDAWTHPSLAAFRERLAKTTFRPRTEIGEVLEDMID